MSLEGKKVLFIAPKFFGYEIEIREEMERLGAEVTYYDERPKNNNFAKAILRLKFKRIIKKRIDDYYNEIINETKLIKFDYIFFIAPETINLEHFLNLKSLHKDSKFILYMWDSIKNKNSKDLINYFDDVYTFDSQDIKNYPKMKFKPLFYIRDYANLKATNLKYDLTFLGTAHTDRYNLVKKINSNLSAQGDYKFFNYFYIQGQIFFCLRKIFDKHFRKVKFRDVSFTSIKKEKVVQIINESKVIIDIQHPKQIGLTMRTIEMLGAQKKIATTNREIENYDFYNKNNVEVIDRDNPIVKREFLESPYQEIDKKIYKAYSLESWLLNIFND